MRFLKIFKLFCILLFFASCVTEEPSIKEEESVEKKFERENSQQTPENIEEGKKPAPDFLTIAAVGDNLFHDPMFALLTQKEPVDAAGFYAEIKPLLQNADIAFVNQETVLAGKDFGYSGYPQFNTPQVVGDALVAAGFNVVNHATNHIMDKGEKAITATINFWEKKPEITLLGIHKSAEDRKKQIIIEKNNIKIGFLSYTYGTNGIPVPKDKPYLVSLIDDKKIIEEVDAIRPNCDLLIASMHWGTEYRQTQGADQEKLAQTLADHKVDIIIGHHPHVLEPTAVLKGKDGNVTFCAYSLGNFISAQEPSPTMLGGMLYIRVKKFEGAVTLEKAGVIPLVTHFEMDYSNLKVYPLFAYTDDLAKKHRRRIQGYEFSVKYFTALAKKILGDAMLESINK